MNDALLISWGKIAGSVVLLALVLWGVSKLAKIAKLDPEKPYLVHCAAGGRSGKSMELFKKLKFTKIYHLADGYNGWADAGKPVVK